MGLDLIDTFAKPYEIWDHRDATLEEMIQSGRRVHRVRTALRKTVASSMDAAMHVAREGTDQGLRNYINDALDGSVTFKEWRRCMPARTPEEIARYQRTYSTSDLAKVSAEIDTIGQTLAAGQCLFHAGTWPTTSTLITDRPLSATFCPDVALRNAEHKSKAFDDGRVDLLVLQVEEPETAVFVFRRAGTSLGHENEVLFAAGATVMIADTQLVRTDYPVSKYDVGEKTVPIYVHRALIS